MHALIIEDEPLTALAIEDALRGCGYASVDFACTVETAVAAARLRAPDLVTADVRLAPGCGMEAVTRICADKQIPSIFITGTPGDVLTRFPDHVIVRKPFNARHVAEAVMLVVRDKT